MSVIRDITNRGRTTIATIHQPSTDVFNLFDKLLLLVRGNIVYLGDANQAVPFYRELGFIYPEDMNPADFLSMSADLWGKRPRPFPSHPSHSALAAFPQIL